MGLVVRNTQLVKNMLRSTLWIESIKRKLGTKLKGIIIICKYLLYITNIFFIYYKIWAFLFQIFEFKIWLLAFFFLY